MKKVKTLEFWLVALLALLVASAWVAGFDGFTLAKNLIPVIAVGWTILAATWIFREILRWFRSWGEG